MMLFTLGKAETYFRVLGQGQPQQNLKPVCPHYKHEESTIKITTPYIYESIMFFQTSKETLESQITLLCSHGNLMSKLNLEPMKMERIN